MKEAPAPVPSPHVGDPLPSHALTKQPPRVAVEVGVADAEPDTERVGEAVAVAEAPGDSVAVGDALGSSGAQATERRMLPPVSATKKAPLKGAAATPRGALRGTVRAGRVPPVEACRPVPATVPVVPSATATARTRWLPTSVTSSVVPFAARESAQGVLKAAPAPAPSTHSGCPFPASVRAPPHASTTRMR